MLLVFLWHLLTITEIKSDVNPSRRSNKTNLIKLQPRVLSALSHNLSFVQFVFTVPFYASISPHSPNGQLWLFVSEPGSVRGLFLLKGSFFVLTVTNVAHRGSSDVGVLFFFSLQVSQFHFLCVEHELCI